MNLAVEYTVYSSEKEIIYDVPGHHIHIFNEKLESTNIYSERNNIYLGVKYNTEDIKIGYKKEEFGNFEYYFRSDENFISIDSSFCNRENCDIKGYLKNYQKINGYYLKLNNNYEEALIFKLKYLFK